MPKVTQLEQQKKRVGRYSIYIDDKYSFSLTDTDVVLTGVYLGQEMSEDELSAFHALSNESKMIDRVYNFLSYRQRTEAEVREYLRRHDCGMTTAESIVERLKRQNMIRDDEFANSWVISRQSLKPRSKRRLEQELRQKGLNSDLIAETLANITDEDQMEAIQRLAKKKLTQIKYSDQSKLIKYLLTQGFDYGLVKRALEDLGTTGGE